VYTKTGVSNLFKPRATEREYLGEEGHMLNFSLSWGATASVIFKMLYANSYESLHN